MKDKKKEKLKAWEKTLDELLGRKPTSEEHTTKRKITKEDDKVKILIGIAIIAIVSVVFLLYYLEAFTV